jgi:hypothetical protein
MMTSSLVQTANPELAPLMTEASVRGLPPARDTFFNHVSRFQIPVDDSLFMSRFQCFDNLFRDPHSMRTNRPRPTAVAAELKTMVSRRQQTRRGTTKTVPWVLLLILRAPDSKALSEAGS